MSCSAALTCLEYMDFFFLDGGWRGGCCHEGYVQQCSDYLHYVIILLFNPRFPWVPFMPSPGIEVTNMRVWVNSAANDLHIWAVVGERNPTIPKPIM